jgi:hypothetical protein
MPFFLSNFSYPLQSFLFNEKRKGFSLLLGYVMIELHVLIICFFLPFPCTTLSCSRSKLTSYKRTLALHTTRTTTVQQTNEYFVFKNDEVIDKLLLYLVLWGVFCRVLSMVNVGTHKATLRI